MRHALTDAEWRVIAPILPRKPRGVPRVDDRRVLNGIFWVLRFGALGVTCPSAMDYIPPVTTVSCVGVALASGIIS